MITLTREEAQQVLDILCHHATWEKREFSVKLLRARLAEPVVCARCGEVNPAVIHTCTPKEQEPVAWQAHYLDQDGNPAVYTTSVYALAVENDTNGTPIPLYTAPPQREWRDPTSAQIKVMWNLTKKPSEFAAMLLAKTREMNG